MQIDDVRKKTTVTMLRRSIELLVWNERTFCRLSISKVWSCGSVAVGGERTKQ
jgi:hypothetical protein